MQTRNHLFREIDDNSQIHQQRTSATALKKDIKTNNRSPDTITDP